MKKTLYSLLFLAFVSPLWADLPDMPNFSLMFHTGVNYDTGFVQGSSPGPEIGAWMGVNINDRFDGYAALDYFTMPNQLVGLGNPVTYVQPTDDVSLSINTRWYLFNNKWDYAHHRFNSSFYLLTGMGIDLVVDSVPIAGLPPPEFGIASNGYDILYAMNFGLGLDMPVGNGREVSLYTEAIDHLIFWQSTTQIFDARFGIRFMLDTAHVDPFR